MTSPDHRLAVLSLYRQLLRLHRNLPAALKAFGDDYAKAEFKRHKTADVQYIKPFMLEWIQYCQVLESQVASDKNSDLRIGMKLDEPKLNRFTDQQIGQLATLRDEARKSLPSLSQTTPPDKRVNKE